MIELVNPKTHAVIPEPQVNAIFSVRIDIFFFQKQILDLFPF